MKHLIELEPGKFRVEEVKGFIPHNSVGTVPSSINSVYYPYLKVREIPDPDIPEATIKEIYVDENLMEIKTAEELQKKEDQKWADMRLERDRLLTDTDFTQLTDAPISSSLKTAYTTYRQELRDLPASIQDINNITWPTKPE